nr:isochorismate synthase [Pullulanibacillus pueri]
MGGFSFNPVLTAAEEWTNYPAAAMVLPQFLLTQRENKAWLTVNKRVTPKDDPKALIATIEEQKNMLLADRTDEEGYFQTHQDLQVTALFPTEWKASVQKAVDKMKAGELEKIVLSRALRVKKEGSLNIPALLYRLKQQQPNSFVFAIERFGDAFVGATPERLVKREGTKFYADALAGTASRGGTQAEDEALGQGLLNDKKNRQEHQFVVKMIKDDFEAFCDKVIIPDRPVLYKTRDVQHLYTPIYGHGKPDAHLLDAISKIHPTPAMGGTPKEKAVALISELESHERGWYSAPVGWIDSNGNGEFSVAIRSGLIRGNEARLFAGCGIVSDSSPTEEFKETEMKFRPMLNALKEE